MIFKIKHEKLGGHIHCALFAAKEPNQTYAKCGDLVVREEEFAPMQRAMVGVYFQEAGRDAAAHDPSPAEMRLEKTGVE